jgi:hypothetical protein
MKSLRSSEVVIFRQYITKKHKRFETKFYGLCYSKGCTDNMTAHFGKDRARATNSMTATHAIVTGLVARIKHVRQTLHIRELLFVSSIIWRITC